MAVVAKKKLSRQITFRLPEEMADRLEKLADRLGHDPSGLLRLILGEQLPAYERRADRFQQGDEEER